MTQVNIAINGFGRIGRMFARLAQNNDRINIIAINDLADATTLAHLFKYDSVHGKFNGTVSSSDKEITINGKKIKLYGEKNPEDLPWDELNIDVVLEATGIFRTAELASKHITAGAKKVLLSAPGKSEGIASYVVGINDENIDKDAKIYSNASCTTNCVAPMVKILHENFEIQNGFITTVHSYTGDQRIHDAPHKDLRRARAAAQSIIPTSTGAANAIANIFPDLEGKLDGRGIRVPVIDGSLTELTCVLKKNTDIEEINALFKQAADGDLGNILEYTDEPLVSVDIINNTSSCIFDSELTKVIGNQVQIIGWYDNEYGYSARLVDLLLKIQ